MIDKINRYILNNKKSVIGYMICFILGFTVIVNSEVGVSEETLKFISDSKLLLQNNNQTIKINSDSKDKINSEIEELNKEIDGLNNSLKELEQQKTDLINNGYVVNSEVNKMPNNQISTAKIHFIDTGNSDAILIKGEKTVLIDGGDNNDEVLLVNYIKNQGISKIDYVIATHPHADHVGGLDAVINSLEIGQVFTANGSSDSKTYTDFINAVANKGLYPSVPLEGSKFELGSGAYIQMFNTNGGKDANEQSLVTLFVNGSDKALFMGDAESGTENEIVSKLPQVDLLKVGHHGSKTSTSELFLNRISPKYAVITVGAGNKYKHPNTDVMNRLKSRNIKVHRTDECGNIIYSSNGNGFSTSCREASYNPGA